MHLLWGSHLRLTPQIYDAFLEDKPNLIIIIMLPIKP
jgi:hypothetical protein